jgi:hypothetical protein
LAWSEYYGGTTAANKFTDSRTLSKISTLQTLGKDIQLVNGQNNTKMFVSSFRNTSSPYYFETSQSLGSFDGNSASKININSDLSIGREGVVLIDSAEFYFSISNINIGNSNVGFKILADTTNITNLNLLNNYLISEPFVLPSKGNFLYSVKYGAKDSTIARYILSGETYVQFKVQLVDDQTGSILGEFDNVKYDKNNCIKFDDIDYQVNITNSHNQMVRLKLIAENNGNAKYFLGEFYSDAKVLEKRYTKIIDLKSKIAVTEYNLEQNYPNPFNPSTTIKYQLPKAGMVTLKIFDMLGKEVANLVNDFKNEGKYDVNFDASKLASGVYIYQIKSNDYISSKKMMLLK